MKRPVAFKITLIATLILIVPAAVLAQVQAGRIVGAIYDPNRAVVPGATVTVTDQNKNISQRVTTNQTGDYVVTPLNPGTYSVSATSSGFQTSVQKDIELLVGQSLRVDLELLLGETSTTVEVKAEIALLNTESGTVGQVMSNTQIVDLPLNGRSFVELARLTPGAAQVSATGNVIAIRPEVVNGNTISGVRGRQVTFLLDGVDTSEQHQGGTYIQTSIDALQEFSVQQNAYSAEFSRAGGFFNATTKSGTNEYHGGLFEFLRNDKLDARSFFALKRDLLKRNQFGGTFGGPVRFPHVYNGKDRTFFFVAYEARRERQGLVFNNIVPTDPMKQGDFSAAGLNKIYDPLSTAANPAGGTIRTAFANNIIPTSRLSSPALFFTKYIASPNSGRSNAIFAPSRALDYDQVTLRGDQELPRNQKFFARWSFHNNKLDDPNAYPALGVVPLRTRGQNVAAGLTGNLKPTVVHEFRFNFLPSTVRLVGFLQGTDFNAQAGIKGFEDTRRPGVAGSFPDFAWSGYTSIQGSAFDQRPKTQDRLAYEFNDNITWVKNKHILKFGGKVRYYQWIGTDSKQYVGNWSFTGINSENPASTAGTGDAFADWMLGYPASVTRAFPGNTFGGQNTYWQLFVQDDFKASSRLTLNLGLRYEYSPWLNGYRGQVGTFDGTKAKPIIDASNTDQIDLGAQWAAAVAYPLFKNYIQTSSQAGLPLSITYPDKRQFGPRLGFAWRPVGDLTVIRGGYGIFYEPENTDGRVNLNMIPFGFNETALNDRSALPQRTMANFFLGNPIGSASTTSGLTPTYTHMRMGYDQHWNFGIQQQMLAKLLVEVNYVGNKGSFLNSSNDLNTPTPAAGTVQTRRPYPTWGGIGYNSQDMASSYHSLQVKAEKRLSAGVWFLVTYTFSKAMLHQQTSAVGGPQAWEKGIADFDVPQNFALSFGYALPFGKGKTFLANAGKPVDLVLGGWQLQGIADIRSGLAFTPTISRDAANTGVGSQRPNRIGSGILDNHTLDKWFDQSAFTQPANFTYGNSGVRILRGDLARVFDFSIFKNFQIRDKARVQFRGEFFNLPNTASFNPPGGAVDTAAGARVTSTVTNPRQIQFGLRLNF